METYSRLAEDMRILILVMGACVVVTSLRGFRTMATPWIGLVMLLFGLTKFIPQTEGWPRTPFFAFPALFLLGAGFDGRNRARREGKPHRWIVPAFIGLSAFWLALGLVSYNRSKLDMTLRDSDLRFGGSWRGITMSRSKLRLLSVNGTWLLKDGTKEFPILPYEKFLSHGEIVSADQLVKRLESWTGNTVEVKKL